MCRLSFVLPLGPDSSGKQLRIILPRTANSDNPNRHSRLSASSASEAAVGHSGRYQSLMLAVLRHAVYLFCGSRRRTERGAVTIHTKSKPILAVELGCGCSISGERGGRSLGRQGRNDNRATFAAKPANRLLRGRVKLRRFSSRDEYCKAHRRQVCLRTHQSFSIDLLKLRSIPGIVNHRIAVLLMLPHHPLSRKEPYDLCDSVGQFFTGRHPCLDLDSRTPLATGTRIVAPSPAHTLEET
jgi:hypothetical protein